MPIYAYRCSACGHAKDVLQKMSDPVLSICPSCGQEAFTKQLTAAGFQLKGSGWYVTDFRDKGGAASAKPEAEAAGAGEGKAEGKADAKTEGKSDGAAAPAPATGSSTAATPAPAPAAAPATSPPPAASGGA